MRDGYPDTWAAAELGDVVAVSRPRSDPQEHPEMPFIGMDCVRLGILVTFPVVSLLLPGLMR